MCVSCLGVSDVCVQRGAWGKANVLVGGQKGVCVVRWVVALHGGAV